MADERRGHAEPADAAVHIVLGDQLARGADPKPLSLDEIFPGRRSSWSSGTEPYRVHMTHIDTDCDIATTGELGQVLGEPAAARWSGPR